MVSLNVKKEIKVTTTIGICALNGEQLISIDHGVDLADQALYQGKKNERSQVLVA